MKKKIVCRDCDGAGVVRCKPCKGLGLGLKDPSEECRVCYGKGTVRCLACAGAGMVESE
jgi:DnaJ-class molecular chaperone